MSQSTWDKILTNRKSRLTSKERLAYVKWKNESAKVREMQLRSRNDEINLREHLKKIMSEDNYLVAHGPSSTRDALGDFGVQCLILRMLDNIALRPDSMVAREWVESELGAESYDDLYPMIINDGRLYLLYDLIYRFGYGPNYFDWSAPKPYMLKDSPSTLYLIELDVGRLASRESTIAWKVGITQKDVIGESRSSARFYGKVARHTRLIRKKKYRDGRDAYMIEQSIIEMSRRETFHDRLRLGLDHVKSEAFMALDDLSQSTVNQIGYSEWVLPYKTEDEVVEIFDRMTSYGEFHAEGNVAYSLFDKNNPGQ